MSVDNWHNSVLQYYAPLSQLFTTPAEHGDALWWLISHDTSLTRADLSSWYKPWSMITLLWCIVSSAATIITRFWAYFIISLTSSSWIRSSPGSVVLSCHHLKPVAAPEHLLIIIIIFTEEHCWWSKTSSVHSLLSHILQSLLHPGSLHEIQAWWHLILSHASLGSYDSHVITSVNIKIFTPRPQPELSQHRFQMFRILLQYSNSLPAKRWYEMISPGELMLWTSVVVVTRSLRSDWTDPASSWMECWRTLLSSSPGPWTDTTLCWGTPPCWWGTGCLRIQCYSGDMPSNILILAAEVRPPRKTGL